MSGNFVAIYTTLVWTAVLIYVLATMLTSWGIIFSRHQAERKGLFAALAAFAAHGGALLVWWAKVGHGPYMARNEVLISDAWVVMAAYFVLYRVYPPIRAASMVAMPATFLLMALGIMFTPEVRTLSPIFTSVWLIFHISFYKIALGTVLMAFSCSLFYILRQRTSANWLDRLPEQQVLELHAYRFAGIGFFFWAVGMLGGSIWAYKSWGRFWGWDPVETWSLITWIAFGLHLHLRRFFRLRGELAAWSYVACFIVALVSAFYTSHLGTSIHSEYFR